MLLLCTVVIYCAVSRLGAAKGLWKKVAQKLIKWMSEWVKGSSCFTRKERKGIGNRKWIQLRSCCYKAEGERGWGWGWILCTFAMNWREREKTNHTRCPSHSLYLPTGNYCGNPRPRVGQLVPDTPNFYVPPTPTLQICTRCSLMIDFFFNCDGLTSSRASFYPGESCQESSPKSFKSARRQHWNSAHGKA